MCTVTQNLIHHQIQFMIGRRRIKTKIAILMNQIITNRFRYLYPNRIIHENLPKATSVFQTNSIKRTVRRFKVHGRCHQQHIRRLFLLPYTTRLSRFQINGTQLIRKMSIKFLLSLFISTTTKNIQFITYYSCCR